MSIVEVWYDECTDFTEDQWGILQEHLERKVKISMANNYGKRVEIGDLVGPKKEHVILYMCPYGCFRHGCKLQCPYKNDEPSLCLDGRTTEYNCPIDIRTSQKGCVCYMLQTVEAYNIGQHKFMLNGKEVKVMELKAVKEARRMPDGNCVAVDDIVEVKVGYVGNGLYQKLNCRNIFTARIVSFNEDHILFDLSETYRASTIEVNYSAIQSISLLEEKKKC